MKWFKEVTSIEELRTEYKALALKYHPDVGGSVKDMQEINSEYDALYARLKAERKEGEEIPMPMMKTRKTRHFSRHSALSQKASGYAKEAGCAV